MKLEQQGCPSPAEPVFSGLQLVWNSNADKDTKARTCAEMLSQLADMCSELGAADVGASRLWLSSTEID